MLPSHAQRRPKALHLLLAAALIGAAAALTALVWLRPAVPEPARVPQGLPAQGLPAQPGSARIWQPCPAAEAPEPAAPIAAPPSAAPPPAAAPLAAPPSPPPSSDAAPHAPPAPDGEGVLAGCKRGE